MIAEILLAHLVGDYLLQSQWMANEKTRRWWPAIVHGTLYTVPFAFITQDWRALAVIGITHVVIDHYRIAKWVTWAKNWIAPIRIWRGDPEGARFGWDSYNPPWSDAKRNAGAPTGTPAYISFWVMVIVDNTLHLLINVAAVRWLG